jgi:hypothetical protein
MRPSGMQLPGRKRQQVLWCVLRGECEPPVNCVQLRSRGVLDGEMTETLSRPSGSKYNRSP